VSLRKAAAEKGIEVKVRTGSPGQFQIFKDGRKVFDHKETGTLLPTNQLLQLL
jgi:predicted Rdx family selenoprotein